MTPDELVEKHKKRIGEFLDSDDQEILDAYVNMRIKQETKKIKFFAKTTDFIGFATIITTGLAILIGLVSLIVFGFMRDDRCTKFNAERDQAVQTVRNEKYALQQECDNKISESQTLFTACQDEQAKLQKVCIENLLKNAE